MPGQLAAISPTPNHSRDIITPHLGLPTVSISPHKHNFFSFHPAKILVQDLLNCWHPMKLPRPPRGFKHVPGFPGYAVNRCGVVASCRRGGMRKHAARFSAPWHVLHAKPFQVKRRGCFYIAVSLCTDSGKLRRRYVHHLVLCTFVGPRPVWHECCHKNGVSVDNRLRNLRWGTPASNRADQLRHGTVLCGENHPDAKLTAGAVRAILASNEMGIVLAARYCVSESTISDVRRGRAWKHLRRR